MRTDAAQEGAGPKHPAASVKILLVEDEKRMAEALSELLRLERYDVTVCLDGHAGLQAVCTGEFDLIVLDVMLPGISGLEIARNARRIGRNTPILMLTAKGGLDDKVTGLDSGADDYLTKPFEAKELLARLRALVRRHDHGTVDALACGDVRLDRNALLLHCTANGQSVRLSAKECRIMELFLTNRGQVLTREQLALGIWGYEAEAEYNNVEVYMSFTRKKLAFIGAKAEIKALRGIGYELRDGRG